MTPKPAPAYETEIRKLAALKAEGAPWHALVTPFLLGGSAAEQESMVRFGRYNQLLDEYRGRLGEIGLDHALLARMARTLNHIDLLRKGDLPQSDFLSDDFEAVEIATRIAWADHDLGVGSLFDLKEGRIGKEEVRRRFLEVGSAGDETLYDPHLDALTQLAREDARWDRVAEEYGKGLEAAQRQSVMLYGRRDMAPVEAYRRRAQEVCGLTPSDFAAISDTVIRLTVIAAKSGRPIEAFVSDDYAAVENAMSLAATRPELGLAALEDLKAGKTSNDRIVSTLAAAEARQSSMAGVHGHWGNFEEWLEFERLHYMCAAGETIMDADWNRLLRLARRAGHELAEQYLETMSRPKGFSDGAIEIYRVAFEHYEEGRYFAGIAESERLLADAGGPEAARAFANRVCDRVRHAFVEGRQARIDADPEAASPKGP